MDRDAIIEAVRSGEDRVAELGAPLEEKPAESLILQAEPVYAPDGVAGETLSKQTRLDLPPARAFVLRDMRIMPTGFLFDAAGRPVGDNTLLPGINLIATNPRWLQWEAEALRLHRLPADMTVTPLMRGGDHIYGHWLIDILPRALEAVRLEPEVRLLWSERLPDFARAMIEALGLEKHLLEIPADAEIEAARVLMPAWPRHGPGVRSSFLDYVARCAEIGGQLDTAPHRRLFVSRSGIMTRKATRNLLNRAEVEARFEAAGFEIIRPETLPFAEQIVLFQSCAVLAGEEGSGLHNSIFMAPGTRVISIQSEANGSDIQRGLCARCSQSMLHLAGEGIHLGHEKRRAPFFVDPADADRLFADLG